MEKKTQKALNLLKSDCEDYTYEIEVIESELIKLEKENEQLKKKIKRLEREK